jgi:hypothetical protein
LGKIAGIGPEMVKMVVRRWLMRYQSRLVKTGMASMSKSLQPLGIANCRAVSSDYAVHVAVEYLPAWPVRDFIISAIQSPSQNRADRLEARNEAIRDLAAQIGGSIKKQAEQIAAGLARPSRFPAMSEQLEKINFLSGRQLAASTIYDIITKRFG